jgi:hypothetical protein
MVKESTEFIDISNICRFGPKEYNILISNMNVEFSQLKHEIADATGILYYLPTTMEKVNIVF